MIIGADARTVRPYMPLANNSSYHFTNPKVQYSNFNIQSLQIIKVKVQCSKFKIKVPICAQTILGFNLIDNQQLIPYVPILAILACKMAHFIV